MARTLGYSDPPVDTASGFQSAGDYLRYALEKGEGAAVRERLRTGRPPVLLFWFPFVLAVAGAWPATTCAKVEGIGGAR